MNEATEATESAAARLNRHCAACPQCREPQAILCAQGSRLATAYARLVSPCNAKGSGAQSVAVAEAIDPLNAHLGSCPLCSRPQARLCDEGARLLYTYLNP